MYLYLCEGINTHSVKISWRRTQQLTPGFLPGEGHSN